MNRLRIVFSIVLLSSLVPAMWTAILSLTNDERTSAEVRNENVLRMDVIWPFGSLHPVDGSDSGSSALFPLLYDYLVNPGLPDSPMEAGLAVDWVYDRENLTWTIKLRKGARFHDGRPVRPADVKYSLMRILGKGNPGLLSTLERIDPAGEDTLKIVLNKDDADFLGKVRNTEILPEPVDGEIRGDELPIGSGPFRFGYKIGEKEVGLVANEDYFGGRPPLDKIVFRYEPRVEESWARLLRGKTDIVNWMNPADYSMIREYRDMFHFFKSFGVQYTILLYNTHDPLFADPDVRTALALAVDKEYIVRDILLGFGVIAAGPVPVDDPIHTPDVQPVPYDPPRALALLESRGWCPGSGGYLEKEGKPFRFTASIPKDDAIMRKVAEYLVIAFNDIGIRMRLDFIPMDALMDKYVFNRDFQAVLTSLGAGDPRRPETLARMWLPRDGKGSEVGCFEDPRLTSLLQGTLSEDDPERGKILFRDSESLIASLQPGTFLYQKVTIDVVSKRVRLPIPFSYSIHGVYGLRRAWILPEATAGRESEMMP